LSIVGVDLGTTNTVVGAVRDGHATTLRTAEGDHLIPSVVSFHPNGTVLVGKAAKERRLIDAANTIYSIKRLIGRSFSSTEVTQARSRFPFQMREGPGQAPLVTVRGETFTLPEISAFVLRHAKAVAEKALGRAVDRAVITVPANFNDLQRAATKVAGRVAGLEVVRILNEPTAAALAYGYGRGAEERIAIYDFGGGTFDITLLDLAGNVFEVLATAGNTFLGGDDIDIAIAERMADRFLNDHRFDPRSEPQAFERVRFRAEQIKVLLSTLETATVEVPEVDPGGRVLSFTMTRAELDELTMPLVLRTFEVCREALGIARLGPADFDQVVLVGGSTRLPLVQRKVEDFFQRTPLDRINPDEVVAIGAAIQANALSGTEKRRSVIPKPPMPAARSFEESVTTALPRPGKRGTNPFGSAVERPPSARPGAVAGAERRRVTTGMGLGQPPEPARSNAPPLPKRKPPEKKGSTLGGVGAPGTPPELAHAVPGSETLAAFAGSPHEEPTHRAGLEAPQLGAGAATFDDDEPTHVGAPPDAFAALRSEAPPLGDPIAARAPVPERALPEPPYRTPMRTQIGLGSDRPRAVATDAPPSAPLRQSPPPAPPIAEEPIPEVASSRPGAAPGGFAPSRAPSTSFYPSEPPPSRPSLPLLIDVTPRSLTVETVGGYCDVLVTRNTKVPCEESRTFVTAHDGQQAVHVRVGQGESTRFFDNTLLGELELSGLRSAPRGKVQVIVTFSLDTDGILDVRAADAETGKEAHARIRLVGLPDYSDVERMAANHLRRSMQ
jgi:molecular chaperone DnaK